MSRNEKLSCKYVRLHSANLRLNLARICVLLALGFGARLYAADSCDTESDGKVEFSVAPDARNKESTGVLTLNGAESVCCSIGPRGFVEATVDGQTFSSDPQSPHYTAALVGATAGNLSAIKLIGQATLKLGPLSTPRGLTVEAERITLLGAISAPELRLNAADLCIVDNDVPVVLRDGGSAGTLEIHARVIITGGNIDAGGASGGSISMRAENIQIDGSLSVNGTHDAGGTIGIHFTGQYEESAAAVLTANGGTAGWAGSGGRIEINGGASGRMYSSGTLSALAATRPDRVSEVHDRQGGEIRLLGRRVTLSAAKIDVSGNGGGTVLIGGEFQGGSTTHNSESRIRTAEFVTANASTTIRADASVAGNGGKVIVWSDQKTECGAAISARGGSVSGNGGYIEVSGKEELNFCGTGDAGARRGSPGTLLLDPKNIVISNPGGMPQLELIDPSQMAGDHFGTSIVVLTNGNIVVADSYDNFAASNGGAVHLFSGKDGALISTIRGDVANGYVGNGGITALSNGNFVVTSLYWKNSGVFDSGAVTWGNGVTGISGVVSTSNSLVGSSASDQVGAGGIVALSNGNYLVKTPLWSGHRGAVTWGSGTTGICGVVSASNSLIGSRYDDQVGSSVTVLSSGNYVVTIPGWDNGGNSDAGAVTWGSGTTGVSGVVSASNSLVGNLVGDSLGSGGVKELSNGNYVVISPNWSNGSGVGMGAVTWANGTIGIKGTISAANSLVGNTVNDQVGSYGVSVLNNGNYVVSSPYWDGGASDAGAVTWGNGTTGINGLVSPVNSLVGSVANDLLGFSGVTALNSGNYVVNSRGKVTWGDGTTGISGVVSVSNSLIGYAVGDGGVTELSNGNYVVLSPDWPNGAATSAGAVTWGSGTTGISGAVSVANSLVGSNSNDLVGNNGIKVLSNGNYVVMSPNWKNGAVADAGAMTWGNGTTGVKGAVSVSNSLIGNVADDFAGATIVQLTNGNYVVRSVYCDLGGVVDVGAVTWGSGTAGVSGAVSASNSLVGSTDSDYAGSMGVTVLSNGNYVVNSPSWTNAGAASAGAVTWGNGTTGISGAVSSSNSLVGTTPNFGIDTGLGSGGITALPSGNYLVRSSGWNGGFGAVVWGDGTNGIIGTISVSNSLVGSTTGSGVGAGGITVLNNGNYVVKSPYWDGTATDVGAITWGNGTTGITGVVSASNSLVGSTANDNLGYDGIIPLSNGNYLVKSSKWDGVGTDSGAVTLGNGATGTCGTVSAQNSLVGLTANSALSTSIVTENKINGTFIAAFGGEPYGKVRVGLSDTALTYSNVPGQTVTLSPAFLKQTLDTGTSVVLQANNDITLNSDLIVNNAGGNGGALTLQAGRSILINANLTTDNGNLTLIANDTGASGVVDANRDAGDALIAVAAGKTLNAGSGTLTVDLRNGAGKANSGSGNITLQAVTAGTISAVNSGPTTGSNILLQGNITANGAVTFSSPVVIGNSVAMNAGSNAITFGSVNLGTQTVTLNGNLTLTAGATLATTINGAGAAQYGHFTVTGTVDLGNAMLVGTLGGGYTPIGGDTLVVADNDGVDAVSGTLNGLPDQGVVSISGQAFHLRYLGGTGNDVVLKANSAPSVPVDSNSAANTIAENAANGSTVGITVIAVDADNDTVAYTLTDNAGGRFAINSSTGLVSVADGTLLNFEAATSHNITVQASDGNQSNTQTFTINVTDVNEAPSIGNQTFSVAENSAACTVVGTVVASDQDTGQSMSYAIIAGNTGNVFAIDATNGQLTVNTPSALNFESTPTFTLTVQVTDNAGIPSSSSATITVKLTDVNEMPVFISAPTATPNPAGVGQVVAFNTAATDPDGQPLTYTWNIDGGTVTGAAPKHAFVTAGVYMVIVTVSDGLGGTATGAVTVTVNAPLVGTGKDSDGDGFSDDFEIASGSSPSNASDSPVGGTATVPVNLNQSKLSIKLNFAKPTSDSISFSGTLPIAAGFNPANKTAIIDVGGVVKSVTLDPKGKSPKGNNSFKLTIKATKGVVAAQTAKYGVKLSKGDFAAALADEGLTNADATKANKSVVVRLIFGGVIYEHAQTVIYSAKESKTGSAQAPK